MLPLTSRRSRPRTSLLLGVALAAATIPVALVPPMAGAAPTIALQLVWRRTFPGVTFRESSPAPAALSSSAYVVGALDGKVYAFDSATGADEPGWPVATSNPVNSSPAAADVLGDGHSIVFVGSGEAATTVAAACSGGGTYAIAPTGAVRWHNIGSDADCANQAFQSSFAIGDTTGDGLPDATIGALGLQSPSYNAISGVMNKGWPFFTDDTVFSSPALADLQGTGVPDIVMGGDATPGPGSFQGGMMRAITGSGQLLWEFKTDEQVRSSPAIGDITGSGTPSIVFGTGNFWLQHGGAVDSTYLFSLNPSGQLQWKRNLGAVTQSSPALADVAGTGHLDVVEGTSGTLANPNAGSIWVLDGNGNPLPNWGPRNSDGGVVIGGISTADLNGDGAQDLLVPTGAGVFIYDGRTAQQIGAIDTGLVSFQGTPLVTDDGGGAVGVTVAGTQPNGTGVVEHYRVAGGRLGSKNWPMFHHDPLHTGNTTTAPMACFPGASPTPPTGKLSRIAGANRDATGVAVSQSSFPAAGSAKAVVVASDANYPDALAGGPLAVARGGPVLITPPSGLPASVDAEIRRVLPLGGTVDVLGGSAAVSPGVDTQLSGEGYLVDRIAGADRFQTAVAIAAALGNPATVLEVTGLNFADALAAGPPAATHGGAILLTNGSAQAVATAQYLAAHARTRYAVGGPAAAADPSAAAISGADRYATAVAVAQRLVPSPSAVGVATGAGFADALTGGPSVANRAGPMLLTPPCGSVPAALTGYLASVASGVRTGTLFGGPAAVGDDVLAQLDSALG